MSELVPHPTESHFEELSSREKANFWWEQNQSFIVENLKLLLREYSIDFNDEFLSEKEKEEKVEKTLARESFFATHVLEAFFEALKKSSAPAILFDIDETIAKSVRLKGSDVLTVLRPTILPLLEEMRSRSAAARMGFLTSRSKEALLQQIDDERHLLSLKNFIDNSLVFSTLGQPSLTMNDFAEEQSKLPVNERVLALESFNPRAPYLSGDVNKLSYLAEHKGELPDCSVVVDDFKYPTLLNTSSFVGVSLKNGGEFFL